MPNNYRIKTLVGQDKFITVNLEQNFDFLEILSLKLSQDDIYAKVCADYGVICGRVHYQQYGIPNAKVSVFFPLTSEDALNPIISELYPYTTVTDKRADGVRYNLLPEDKQHSGHNPTGTFPGLSKVLSDPIELEIYEKYYKLTVKTNNSGDYMIFGSPLNNQIIHAEVDLSDIGCFSLVPQDFINQGIPVQKFKNNAEFNSSDNLDSLPQIVSQNKAIDVTPFWGDEDLCDVGINRVDFSLSDSGVKIEPTAIFMGSITTDSGKYSVDKNCMPRRTQGNSCNLTTGPGIIDAIRFTPFVDENNQPVLEVFDTGANAIDDNGAWLLMVPMNLDRVITDEFGNNVITFDQNIGLPTKAKYRFRVRFQNDIGGGRARRRAAFLVPNIREFATGSTSTYIESQAVTGNDDNGYIDPRSYAFSVNVNDYPDPNLVATCQDYFYEFSFNRVYTVAQFYDKFKVNNNRERFIGIKEIFPAEDDQCSSNVSPHPANSAIRNSKFIIMMGQMLLRFQATFYTLWVSLTTLLIAPFQLLADINIFGIHPFGFLNFMLVSPLMAMGTVKLEVVPYDDCEKCDCGEDLANTQIYDADQIQSNYKLLWTGCARAGHGLCDKDNILIDDGTLNCSGTCSETSDVLDDLQGGTDLNALMNNIQSNLDGNIVGCGTEPLQFVICNNDKNECALITMANESGGLLCSSAKVQSMDPNLFLYNDGDDNFTDRPCVSTSIYCISPCCANTSGETIPQLNTVSNELDACNTFNQPISDDAISFTVTGCQNCICSDGFNDNEFTCTTQCTQLCCGGTGCIQSYCMSRYSKVQGGCYTIVPNVKCLGSNLKAINEWRKLTVINIALCNGLMNYILENTWLNGSLYAFQFKAKIKKKHDGDKPKYCKSVVYYDGDQKLFYYRSTPFDSLTNQFIGLENNATNVGHNKKEILFPTTVTDLGPRSSFLNQICFDPNLDISCSMLKKLGSTSFQNLADLMFISSEFKIANGASDLNDYFSRDDKRVDGDIAQLISTNSEAGILEFDVSEEEYSGYTNVSNYTALEPIPIEYIIEDDDIRSCLRFNLNDTTQVVPYYSWAKGNPGFGLLDQEDFDTSLSVILSDKYQGLGTAFGQPVTPITSAQTQTNIVLSNPYLFYFGLRPGATAYNILVNKFVPPSEQLDE